MRASITEAQAWEVVRAVPVGAETVGIPHPADSEVAVEVAGDGSWSTPAFVTDAGRRVLDLYLPLRRLPAWVVGQMGQSLDGRIATESGDSHYVTGPEDIRRLHRLRALADAVVVGAGTAASDDPQLTVREVTGDDPVRVVLDTAGRLDPELGLFQDGGSPTVLVRARPEGEEGASGSSASLARGSVTELVLPASSEGRVEPRMVVEALAELGLRRILVEGGGLTVSGFLEAGVVDRLHVTVAPLILGSGRAAFTLAPVETLGQALRPRCRTFPLGDDVLFDLDLRTGALEAPGQDDDAG